MQTYALTILTHRRRAIFLRTANADLMLEILFRHRANHRYQLHAFAVMSDHIHVLLTPVQDLSRCIQYIKGGFSHAVRHQFQAEVWHSGHFEHRIRNAEDFHNQQMYIAQNPMRRHLENYSYVHTRYPEQIDPMPSHLR